MFVIDVLVVALGVYLGMQLVQGNLQRFVARQVRKLVKQATDKTDEA